jgi:putative SOS response-associated peptidase YedK
MRYAATLPPPVFHREYGYSDSLDFPPRDAIRPTEPVVIVDGDRRCRLVRWQFLPGWAGDPRDFPFLAVARSEGILEKAAFRAAATRRRCIFLADGFYEWRRQGRRREPFLIRMASAGPMPIAGVWETWCGPNGEEVDGAAIVTTGANGVLAAISERMPVILDREGVDVWLDHAGTRPEAAIALARPCPEDRIAMSVWPQPEAGDSAQGVLF